MAKNKVNTQLIDNLDDIDLGLVQDLNSELQKKAKYIEQETDKPIDNIAPVDGYKNESFETITKQLRPELQEALRTAVKKDIKVFKDKPIKQPKQRSASLRTPKGRVRTTKSFAKLENAFDTSMLASFADLARGSNGSNQNIISDLGNSFQKFLLEQDLELVLPKNGVVNVPNMPKQIFRDPTGKLIRVNFEQFLEAFKSSDTLIPNADSTLKHADKKLKAVYKHTIKLLQDKVMVGGVKPTSLDLLGKIKLASGKDYEVISRLVQVDKKGKYSINFNRAPSTTYDPAIANMFKLFKSVKELEVFIESTGDTITFAGNYDKGKRYTDSYRVTGVTGNKARETFSIGSKFSLPKYSYTPTGQSKPTTFIPNKYDNEGIATKLLTKQLFKVSYAKARSAFDSHNAYQSDIREDALNVLSTRIRSLLENSQVNSLDTNLSLTVGDIKKGLKLDFARLASGKTDKEIASDANLVAMEKALDYYQDDNLTLRETLNPEYLSSLDKVYKLKATESARKVVSNKLSDIYNKYFINGSEDIPKELMNPIIASLSKTFEGINPTDKTFSEIDLIDEHLHSLQADGKVREFLQSFGVNKPNVIQALLGKLPKDKYLDFLDINGSIKAEALDELLEKSVYLGRHDHTFDSGAIEFISSHLSDEQKIGLGTKGIMYSRTLASKLKTVEPIELNKLLKARGINKLFRQLLPGDSEGTGIYNTDWAADISVLGDNSLFHRKDDWLDQQSKKSTYDYDVVKDFEDQVEKLLIEDGDKYERELTNEQLREDLKKFKPYDDSGELLHKQGVVTANSDIINATDNTAKAILASRVNGRVDPETIYPFFETGLSNRGVVQSKVQQLVNNAKHLSPTDLLLVEDLSHALGFSGSSSIANPKTLKKALSYLLRLQTAVNNEHHEKDGTSARLQNKVSVDPSSISLNSTYIAEALKGKKGQGVDSSLTKKSKKGRHIYTGAAGLYEDFSILSGFADELFGTDLDDPELTKLFNSWRAKKELALNAKHPDKLPNSGSPLGAGISQLERSFLKVLRPYYKTSLNSELPNKVLTSSFINTLSYPGSYAQFDGKWAPGLEYDFSPIADMHPEARLDVYKQVAPLLHDLAKEHSNESLVYAALKELSVVKPNKPIGTISTYNPGKAFADSLVNFYNEDGYVEDFVAKLANINEAAKNFSSYGVVDKRYKGSKLSRAHNSYLVALDHVLNSVPGATKVEDLFSLENYNLVQALTKLYTLSKDGSKGIGILANTGIDLQTAESNYEGLKALVSLPELSKYGKKLRSKALSKSLRGSTDFGSPEERHTIAHNLESIGLAKGLIGSNGSLNNEAFNSLVASFKLATGKSNNGLTSKTSYHLSLSSKPVDESVTKHKMSFNAPLESSIRSRDMFYDFMDIDLHKQALDTGLFTEKDLKLSNTKLRNNISVPEEALARIQEAKHKVSKAVGSLDKQNIISLALKAGFISEQGLQDSSKLKDTMVNIHRARLLTKAMDNNIEPFKKAFSGLFGTDYTKLSEIKDQEALFKLISSNLPYLERFNLTVGNASTQFYSPKDKFIDDPYSHLADELLGVNTKPLDVRIKEARDADDRLAGEDTALSHKNKLLYGTEGKLTYVKDPSVNPEARSGAKPLDKYNFVDYRGTTTDEYLDTFNSNFDLGVSKKLGKILSDKIHLSNKMALGEPVQNTDRYLSSMNKLLSSTTLDSLKARDSITQMKILNRLFKNMPKFAKGGHLPGNGDKDTIPALLMPGETVLTKSTSRALGIGGPKDYNKFKDAVEAGRVRYFSNGGNDGNDDLDLEGLNLDDTSDLEAKKAKVSKQRVDAGITIIKRLEEINADRLANQDRSNIKQYKVFDSDAFRESFNGLNDEDKAKRRSFINKTIGNQSFLLSIKPDELKNLVKSGVIAMGMDSTTVHNLVDSLFSRKEGDKSAFSHDDLNTYSGFSTGEKLTIAKYLNNFSTNEAFGQLVSQSDRFSHARSWYESNGMDTRGGFDIPKSSIFTTNANIDSTTKLLKDLYKNQELASKLGLDTVKMVGDITNEQDFIKKYINDKDAFKENILDPYSKNTKVVQSAISGLDDHDINRAKKIVGGLTGTANAIDPDDVGVEVKGDNISAAANAAQGFRNSAVTRWANFKEQMMQNAAYMAGYGALSLPIAAGASVMSGAVEFENSLKNLQAITGSTSEQMNLMSKSIKQVSVDTKFSATEISGAATILGQAGFSAADISASLSGIVKLATATGSSLEDSTNTITSALTVWDRPLTDSGSMANEMTAAINKSKLDMGSITSSVQYAGNIAAQGGIPLTDLLTMTSLMKDAGIKQPSTIATGSRLVYSDFMAPSKKFAKSLKDASIQLEDFQSVFENGGIIETVKFLKSKGYGFAEASKGMEVRERVAFTAMLNQIDKADSFKASITGTQAADTANSVQMKSFTNSFKNMLNSWQVEMNTASEGLLGSLAKGARFLTKEVPDKKQSLFGSNEELVSTQDWTASLGSALTGLGLGGALYIGSKKLLDGGSVLGSIDKTAKPKTAKALGLIEQTGGLVSKGTSWVGKRLPYIGAGTGVAIDAYDSYQESGIGAAIIDGIGSALKEVIPTVSAFLAAPFGGPTGVGNLAAGVAGYGVGSSIQSALGLDDLVDKGTNATKKAVLGGPNQDELYRSFLARSESQNNLVSDLSKYSKILDDDKLFKLQASDKENTDTAKANRQAKEQGAYNKALELDTIYAEQLAVLSKPMSFTSGVYDSYNATGGKVSAQQKLAENTENIAKVVANKVVETQTKKLPSTAPHLGDVETLDKQKTKASVLAYLSSEGTKDFSEMASKNPLAYLTNSGKVKKDLEAYLKKAMEHTGKFTEEEIKAFTATQVKKMDNLFESNNLSSQPKQVLDAMEQAIKKDPTLVDPIRGNKLLNNIKTARQNVYLEESGFNKFKDKVQEYRSLVADSNKETFKVVSKIADSVNDFNFKAISSIGKEGYDQVSSLAKTLSVVNDDFNDKNNLKLLGKYGSAGLAKAINNGDRDSIEKGKYLPSLSKLGESKIKAFDSLGEAADLLTSNLIGAAESADVFAKNKLLTGSKSKAIANNDMIDYNFSKALEQAFVSKGIQVGSIDKLLATDISTLKVGDRGDLAKLFDSDFNKKLNFQKQTAIEDIDYNANLQKRNSTRDYEFSKQVNDLQMSFKTQDIERNRQHNIEEAGINFERQVASLGRQRGYAVNGARVNLAHNLYQIGVNFHRNLQKLETDRSRSLEKLATDISRAQQKIETDKTRNEAGAKLGYSRGLEDLGTNKTRNVEDASKNLARNLEDLATSVARSKEKLNIDIARSTADANVSYNRQVTAIQQSMADTVTMFERSLTKPVNIQLDPESLIKVADNIDNLSLAMDAHKASLEANTSAVKQYLGINQSKEDLVKGAYIQAYKASGGDVNSDTFKTSYEEYMKSNGSQLVDTVLGYGLDTALAGGVDLTRALSDPTYLANMVANPTDGVTTEDAVINSGMTANQLVTALLGNGQGQYTIQTTQGVVLEAKGDMEGALFDLESQMINFGFSLRDAATNLSYAITDIQTSFDRALEDILTNEQQQLEDINLGFSRAIADIELAYSRGLEDLNLSLTRNFADIALQYQYALEDLSLSQSQSMADLQLAFSQSLDDLKLNTEWQRQDALTSFSFALQEINMSYQQSLNEAAINYQNQLNDINRNAAWQLSETFINNEQNKQIMELQFQQLLTNINLATDESKANIERQIGQQLASVVLDLQAMRTSIETQFRTSLSSTVFDLTIAMTKIQEGLDKAASEADIDLSELTHKIEVAFNSLANDEKIKASFDRLDVTFEEITRIIEEGGNDLDTELRELESKFRDAANSLNNTATNASSAASAADIVGDSIEDLKDSTGEIRTDFIGAAADASSTRSTLQSTSSSIQQSGVLAMNSANSAGQMSLQAVSSLAQMLAQAEAQIRSIQARAASFSPDYASVGAVIPGYGGGDILPFMLEPGEAVVRKEAVRALGADFFRQLNSSPNSLSQGLVTGAIGLEQSTQSTTAMTSGYNINIQVAPDASLSTIERNIDKIANGVRQVFEEYL